VTQTLAARPATRRDRARHPFFQRPEIASLAFLIGLVIVLSLTIPSFRTAGNLQGIVSQIAVVGVVALAVNQVILCGEIDISTGAMLGLCAAVGAGVAEQVGGFIVPLLAAIAVGVIVGAINGALSTWAKIPSIIVTLGMLNVLRGGLLTEAGGQVFNPPTSARFLGQGIMPIGILAITAAVFGLINTHSTWGRNCFAVGGNSRAALLTGVPENRVKFFTFIAVGVCVGIASMIYVGQIGQVQATAGTGFELQAIAAVVVGGTSITGGRGSTAAPVVGAILIGVILNALALLGIAGTWQDLALGAMILLAICTGLVRRRFLGGSDVN